MVLFSSPFAVSAQTLQPSAVPSASPTAEEETIVPTFETQKLARTYILDVPAPRGQITDRNGVPLAQNRLSYNLAINFPTPLDFSDAQTLSFVREKMDKAGKLTGRTLRMPDEVILRHYRNRGIMPLEIAQNLSNAYESWQAENAPQNNPVAKQAPPASGGSASAEFSDADHRPYWEEPDDGRRPYWEEQPAEKDTPPVQPKSSKKHDSAPDSRTGSQSRPPAEDSPPPLSGEFKAELNTQIKRQLIERQTPATTSNTEDLPDSLKPGHTLFRVNTPLDVPSKGSGQYCSLRANDYIERTGDVDQNGMVPVKVKVGGPSDCAIGLRTNVSVNDLEAMESEQQQALTDALLAASKNMGGSRGLPQGPGTTPMLIAAGQTRPAPDAMTTLSQLQ